MSSPFVVFDGGAKRGKKMGFQAPKNTGKKIETMVVPLGLHKKLHNNENHDSKRKNGRMIVTETTEGGTIHDDMVDAWLEAVK